MCASIGVFTGSQYIAEVIINVIVIIIIYFYVCNNTDADIPSAISTLTELDSDCVRGDDDMLRVDNKYSFLGCEFIALPIRA